MISATVLTFIGGLITSFLPNLLRMWEKKQEHKHETELLKIRLEAMAKGLDVSQRIAEIHDADSARQHDIAIPYTDYYQGLRAAVRPVLTFSIFILFCVIKIVLLFSVLNTGMDLKAIMSIVWSVDDQAMMLLVLGFWFGQRTIEKNGPSDKR